jgi:hypothetical protein
MEQKSPDIWDLSDLGTPWSVHVVATLGIAEHIANGTTNIGDLAAASGADSDSLHRVMRHLVSKGMFEQTAPGQFALNEPSRVLLNPGVREGLNLDAIGGRMAYAWGSLLQAVRTGAPAYHTVFERPFWQDLEAHPKIAESFDTLMGPGHGTPDPDVLPAGDWEPVRIVVDVGGGTGSLLAEILRTRRNVRGILVDLPSAIARSGEIFQSAGVAERVTTAAQSFFDPLPAGGDVYLLKSILADWPDREALAILKRCAEAAHPQGRVVVLNGVSPDDALGVAPQLLMMVLVGGRERSLTEFRAMAREAGLRVQAAAHQPSGRYVVECRTATSETALHG